MNQHPQAQQAPARQPPIATPAQAHKLAEEMLEVMCNLLAVVEKETELVRAASCARRWPLSNRRPG